jgi:soluble lytic murein transglycosylase-like protein
VLRRSRPLSLAVLVTAGALVGGSVAAAAPTTATELPEIEEQLSQAEADLAATDAAIAQADASLLAARSTVQAAASALAAVEADLAQARAAEAAAAVAERDAAREIAAANEQLEHSVDVHTTSRSDLERRAVQVYKHGPGVPEATLLRGIAGSSDWHEVAITMEAVARIVERDRRLVQATGVQTRDLAASRTSVVQTRQDAVRTARDTTREAHRVAQLVERQQRAVAALSAEQAALAALLEDLEADAQLRAALVRRLESEVARLQLASSTVLVPIAPNVDLNGPPPPWAGRLPAAGRPWAGQIDAVAASRGVDGRLLAALVWTESNFRPDAVSHAGAIGLAQLMPGTAAGLGVDPWDPVHNLDGGTRYLRTQLERFGRVDLALAAYNAGPNRVERAGPGIPNIVETQLYVVRVIERYRELSGG